MRALLRWFRRDSLADIASPEVPRTLTAFLRLRG